jgi:hypothetical protein
MGRHQLRKKCEFFRENINRKNDFNKINYAYSEILVTFFLNVDIYIGFIYT